MKLRLIDEWRSSWRFGSVWLSWAAAALVPAILGAAPGLILSVLHSPLLDRLVVGGMVGVAIVISAWTSRIVKKVKPDA